MRVGWFSRLAIILLFAPAGFSGLTQQESDTVPDAEPQTKNSVTYYHSHIYCISPDESARRNPIEYSVKSVERGAKLFADLCSMCHGQSGKGNGRLALKMKVHVPDLTAPKVLEKLTDGEIFAIQSRDFPVMPEQNYRRDNRKWDIVNFLRSISTRTSVKNEKSRHRADAKSSQK